MEIKEKLEKLLPEKHFEKCSKYVSHYQIVSGELRGNNNYNINNINNNKNQQQQQQK